MSSKKLLKNTIIILIGNLGSKILVFIMIPLYTKWLTASEYGIYDTMMSAASFLMPFLTLQLEQANFNLGIRYNEKRNILLKNSFLYAFIAVIFFNTVFTIFRHDKISILFSIFVTLQCFQVLCMEYNRGKGRLKEYALSNIFILFIVLLCNYLFVGKANQGLLGVLWAYIIAYAVFLIQFIFRNMQCVTEKIDVLLFKTQLVFSLPLVPNAIGFWITNLSDRFAILFILDSCQNGIYAVAAKFPTIITLFYSAFVLAWQEEAIRLVDDKEAISSISNRIIDVLFSSLILGIPFLKYIIKFAFPSEYSSSVLLAMILMFATVYLCVSQFIAGILMAVNDTKVIGISTLVSAFINIVINILFLHYGLWIAAFSTLVSYITMLAIRGGYISRMMNMSSALKRIGVYSILVLLFLPSYEFYSTILNVIYIVCAGAIFIITNRVMLKNISMKVWDKILILFQ